MSTYPPRSAPTHFPADPDALARLHARLAAAAEARGALDVTYRTVDSPVGELLLAATDAGLVRVAFAGEGVEEVLTALAERIGPRILHHAARLDVVARELEEYFHLRRRTFDLTLDRRLSSGFRLQVQRYLPQIGFGQTATYKQVAQQVGNPNAVRAVGTACATNPLPIVVPCHRVLRSDGSPGGYVGGAEAKGVLLELEQAT